MGVREGALNSGVGLFFLADILGSGAFMLADGFYADHIKVSEVHAVAGVFALARGEDNRG